MPAPGSIGSCSRTFEIRLPQSPCFTQGGQESRKTSEQRERRDNHEDTMSIDEHLELFSPSAIVRLSRVTALAHPCTISGSARGRHSAQSSACRHDALLPPCTRLT